METPLVSVCIQTYQHVNFIRTAIESVLSQEVDFPMEILIGEDESTDGTREICIDIADNHPDKIMLFLNKRENVIIIDGEATGRWNFMNNFLSARGKYITILPGDDYWTDNKKLQKQVDFMENHSDFSICFHAVDVLQNNNIEEDYITEVKESVTGIIDLAEGNYIHTPSVLYRNCLPKGLPEFFNSIPVGDYPLHLLMAEHGKIKYFPEKMAVYRVHEGGRWSMQNEYEKKNKWIAVIDEMLGYFENNKIVRELLFKQKMRIIIELIEQYRKTQDEKIIKDIMKNQSEINISMYADWILVTHKEAILKKNIESKYNRIRNHPVVKPIIRLLSFLKNDPSFN